MRKGPARSVDKVTESGGGAWHDFIPEHLMTSENEAVDLDNAGPARHLVY